MTPIDPRLWHRADALFQEAIDLPAPERDAFVARACGDDRALLAAVREMLAADSDAGGILETPANSLAASAFASDRGDNVSAVPDEAPAAAPDPWIGRSLGRFRIVRRIGEGGMGIVYEAEQEEPRRAVALKLMRGGWSADAAGLRFFRREAQTLARLQHPGIAAIYEAGTTDDGQPFFAMELVRGVPLDAAGTSGAVATVADMRRRVEVFLDVCDAIVYAHQRGVTHRDLKPSNILVAEDAFAPRAPRDGEPSTSSSTRAPRVKVVDFGLARISDAEATMMSSRTEPRTLQGTLPYMSPEQTLGRPEEIDFRSDVYSLGVILFKLLAGSPPYVVRADALLEAVRIIREEAPRRAGAVAPILRGDMETILAKALEKDPDRRYQSVASFADDLRRFLSDQPILARPSSAVYHLRKLAARHRAASALLLTLFAVLVGATAALSILYQAQARERAKAVAEAAKATTVSDFLVRMLTSVDPEMSIGVDVTVREVLDAAARDVEPVLRESPGVAATLQSAIGQAYVSLGLYAEAEPQLRASLEARRAQFGESDPEYATGLWGVAQPLMKTGKLAEAESLLAEALAIRHRAFGDNDPSVAEAIQSLAIAASERGDHTRADSLYGRALRIWEAIDPASSEVFACLNYAALTVQSLGRYAEAESLYHRALTIAETRFGEDHPQYAHALNNLGLLLTDQRRLAEADSTLRRALEVRLAAFGPDHPEVAITRNNLARALRMQDRYEEAVPLYEQAIAAFEKRLGPEHQYTSATRNNLGLCYDLMGRYDLATSMFEDAIVSLRNALGRDHPSLVKTFSNLGYSLVRAGKLERAAEVLLEGMAMQDRLAPDHPEYATAAQNLVAVRRAQGRFAEAESLNVAIVDTRRRRLGPDHLETAGSEMRLAELLLRRGRVAEADSLLAHALAIQLATFPATSWRVALTKSALGACRLAQGRRAEAESLLVASSEVIATSPAVFEADRRASRERLAALQLSR